MDPNRVSLGHFEVQRVVGEGGFGKVNAVQRTTTQQWYAMKKLTKMVVVQNDGVQMVFNELELLKMVNNPHLINMHFAFHDREACYLVMDLELGGDLRFHLKFVWPEGSKTLEDRVTRSSNDGGFDEPRVRFYIACTILALEYLHSVKILHRDIKPEVNPIA